MSKDAGPIDKLIGSKIRAGRLHLRMSQTDLANALGITFQQVQKYEKGTNRVSASRLYRISELYNLDISSFFDGAESAEKDQLDGVTGLANLSKGDFQTIQFLSNLQNPELKKALRALVEAVG